MNEKLANCRICLGSPKDLFSIYENVKSKNLPLIIEEISGVVINALKEPFATICCKCSDEILQADATIQKCRQSDKILLEQQRVKIEGDAIDKDEGLKQEAIEIHDVGPEETYLDPPNLIVDLTATKSDGSKDTIKSEKPKRRKRTSTGKSHSIEMHDVGPEETYLDAPNLIVDLTATKSDGSKDTIKSEKPKRRKRTSTGKSHSEAIQCTRQLGKRAITSDAASDSTESRKYIRKINSNKEYFFQCEHCTFASFFAKYFREHMQQVHNETNPRIFKCQKCPKTYMENRYLKQHIAYVHEQRPRRKKFLCAECGQGFNKSNHLYYHQRSHLPKERRTPEPLVKCEQCDKEFSKLSIRMHVKNVHSIERPFACALCRSSFALAKGLLAHMKVCHPTELFICRCCEVRFRVRSVYETHIQRGTCQKLGYNCDYCAWGFKTQHRLEKHKLQVHKEILEQLGEIKK